MTEYQPDIPAGYDDTKALVHATQLGNSAVVDAVLEGMDADELRAALRYSTANIALFHSETINPDYAEAEVYKTAMLGLRRVRAFFDPVMDDVWTIAGARTRKERADYAAKVALAIRETDAYIQGVQGLIDAHEAKIERRGNSSTNPSQEG